jgi:anti-anti-sigma factor
MNTHLTSSTTTQYAHTQITATEAAVADRTHPIGGDTGLAPVAHMRPQLTLARPPAWSHKLILTGSLNGRSALELEDEIECLCQEGVTTLTLDLRQLDAIDATGIRVIASRGAVCRQRGRELAVISGSRIIQRALAEAGAPDLLSSDPSGVAADPGVFAASSLADRSTTMIKSL